jgi:hypothetical protein
MTDFGAEYIAVIRGGNLSRVDTLLASELLKESPTIQVVM